jgi:hypothetical protein
MEAQERAAMLLLKKIVPFGFEGIAAQLPQSRRLLEAKKGLRNLV